MGCIKMSLEDSLGIGGYCLRIHMRRSLLRTAPHDEVSRHRPASFMNTHPFLTSIARLILATASLQWLGVIILALAGTLALPAEAAEPKRVLIIHSFGRDYAPFNAVGIALRTELTKQLRQPVAFRDVSLDIERFGVPQKERALIAYLLSSSDEIPDMVVTIGAPATRFYLRHREVLFPDRPLLVTGIDSRMLRGIKLGAKDRTVTVDQEFSGVARTIRELQPGVTTLALVLGASPHEQFWAEEIRREIAQADSHLRVLPPEALSLEQMRQRVSGLPPNSAVFYLLFNLGADGVQHENEQALAAIREASSAPIYGIWANQLGAGVVGGAMFDTRQMGRVTAELAASMLESGHGADSNRVVDKEPPAFDRRELERWGIPESRLPPGAQVLFRPPSLWEQHRLLILTGAAIVLLQAALIAALLTQRRVRRRAEFELRESEQRMSLVAAATGLGMWVEDIPRRTFWASPQQFALLGIGSSEPYDFERFLQAVHVDDRGAVREAVSRAMESGGEYDVRYRVPLANGAVRWVTARGRGELDTHGRPVRMRGVTADDTARVEAGIEARRHENELAHLSRIAMLGQLSGSIAHELNQPLTAILSNAQAALRFLKADGADLQEIRDILADIVVDDQRAGNVIRRLRALFERGEANREPLDLNELIHEILRLLHSDFVSRNISIATELEPRLPLVNGDRIQLQQLLLNLAVNACEAMADVLTGQRRLVFRTESDNGQVVVYVTDHGKGIAPDQLERIFEPFVTSKSSGIGLGLAIGRSIITAHGGRLWATVNSDRGATLSFSLPARDVANPSVHQSEADLVPLATSVANAPRS